jgi:hypothetical protein
MIRQILTWPGDVSLEFLCWREDNLSGILYWTLLPIALVAHALTITADMVDDVFDHFEWE